eukprot:scaffold12567_cov143-Isochrysis_galbana.AAC.4
MRVACATAAACTKISNRMLSCPVACVPGKAPGAASPAAAPAGAPPRPWPSRKASMRTGATAPLGQAPGSYSMHASSRAADGRSSRARLGRGASEIDARSATSRRAGPRRRSGRSAVARSPRQAQTVDHGHLEPPGVPRLGLQAATLRGTRTEYGASPPVTPAAVAHLLHQGLAERRACRPPRRRAAGPPAGEPVELARRRAPQRERPGAVPLKHRRHRFQVGRALLCKLERVEV